jgi:phage I-like protein
MPGKNRAKPRTKAPPLAAPPAATSASAQATRLAADIEGALADGRIDALSPQALQALMAAACKAFAAQIEAGNPVAALAQRTSVTPTEVMVTASGLLRAANLAVFELGMWQSWTGR